MFVCLQSQPGYSKSLTTLAATLIVFESVEHPLLNCNNWSFFDRCLPSTTVHILRRCPIRFIFLLLVIRSSMTYRSLLPRLITVELCNITPHVTSFVWFGLSGQCLKHTLCVGFIFFFFRLLANTGWSIAVCIPSRAQQDIPYILLRALKFYQFHDVLSCSHIDQCA